MEAAFAAIGSAFTGATATVGAGLSSLGSAVGLTGLQGVTTAASALSSIGSGLIAKQQGRHSAGMHRWAADNASKEAAFSAAGEEMNAQAEYLAGADAAIRLREDLHRTIGGQRVAFAASGVDPLSGTPAKLEDLADARTADELEQIRSQTEVNRLSRRIKASQMRLQGIYQGVRETAAADSAETGGSMKMLGAFNDAINSFARYKLDVAKRGV